MRAPQTDAAAPVAAPPLLKVHGLCKSFAGEAALWPVTFTVNAGEFFAVLGPSGCGKSTLLRLLAGLERADGGCIELDGRDITALPAYARPLNMMFQSYALFPHLSVAGNVAFGLKQEGLPKAQIQHRVDEVLALLQLNDYASRKPAHLSGGQCQRVALARALVKRPRILLLDEPLAALDKQLREHTQYELRRIQQELGMTFIVVTHDQHEAMSMADRMAVMQHGRIARLGSPAAVYEQPGSRYVAEFVGDVNLLSGRVLACRPLDGAWQVQVRCEELATVLTCRHPRDVPSGTPVWLALRPEKLRLEAVAGGEAPRLVAEGTAGAAAHVAAGAAANAPARATARTAARAAVADNIACHGRVQDITYLGSILMYHIRVNRHGVMKVKQANIGAGGSAAARPCRGDHVRLSWDAGAMVLLDE